MKITRIFLFASPLLLLVPPLFPPSDNPAWMVFSSFYSLIVGRFPWNLVMAALCYNYAQQLGRDAFVWAGFSFFFPFATPLVLAFRSPKYNSTADVVRRMQQGPAKAKAATGPFNERFPLLTQYLQGRPEADWAEQKARFDPVRANYEFLLAVDPNARVRMMAEASTRHMTTWTDTTESGTKLFGAAFVELKDLEEVAKWLKGGAVSGEKLSIVWRQPDGVIKSLEYYAA
jgi:hypothetical protein